MDLLFNVNLICCPQAGEQLVRVNQDTRLNYRVLDMRTPANQGIFRIQCQVSTVSSLCYFIFLKVLWSKSMVILHEIGVFGIYSKLILVDIAIIVVLLG